MIARNGDHYSHSATLFPRVQRFRVLQRYSRGVPRFREGALKPGLRCPTRSRRGIKTYLPGLFLLIQPLSERRILKQSDKRSISRPLRREYQAFSLTFARSAGKTAARVNAVDSPRLMRLLRSINNLIQSALTIESQFSVPIRFLR